MINLPPTSRPFEPGSVFGDLCPEARRFTHLVFHLYEQARLHQLENPAPEPLANRAAPFAAPDLIVWLKSHHFFHSTPKTCEEINHMIQDIILYAPQWGLGDITADFKHLGKERDVESADYQYDVLSLFLDRIVQTVIQRRPPNLSENTPTTSFRKETFFTKSEVWLIQHPYILVGLTLNALIAKVAFYSLIIPALALVLFTPLAIGGTVGLILTGLPQEVAIAFLSISISILFAQRIYSLIKIAKKILNYGVGWDRSPTTLAKVVNFLFFDIWTSPTDILLNLVHSLLPKISRPVNDKEGIVTALRKMCFEEQALQKLKESEYLNTYLRWRAISDITLNPMFATNNTGPLA